MSILMLDLPKSRKQWKILCGTKPYELSNKLEGTDF